MGQTLLIILAIMRPATPGCVDVLVDCGDNLGDEDSRRLAAEGVSTTRTPHTGHQVAFAAERITVRDRERDALTLRDVCQRNRPTAVVNGKIGIADYRIAAFGRQPSLESTPPLRMLRTIHCRVN